MIKVYLVEFTDGKVVIYRKGEKTTEALDKNNPTDFIESWVNKKAEEGEELLSAIPALSEKQYWYIFKTK